MTRLEDFLPIVQSLTRETFAKRYPQPVLVGRLRTKPSESDWHFRTQTMSVGSASPLAWMNAWSLAPEAAGLLVFTLEKSLDNPWRERISIGRARNNDIVLADGSVSKLHAYVRQSPEGTVTVQDCKSRNGTSVNGRRLVGDERLTLTSGDVLTFGRVELFMLEALSLYDFVAKNTRRRQGTV